MIPERRSRLCFLLAAIAALGSPFVPDAVSLGKAAPLWIRTPEGVFTLVLSVPIAGVFLSGAWTRSREDMAISLGVMISFVVGTFLLFEFSGTRQSWVSRTADFVPFAVLVSLAAPLALFGLSGDPSIPAGWARMGVGVQGLSAFLVVWADSREESWFVAGFGVAGLLVIVGEALERIADRAESGGQRPLGR